MKKFEACLVFATLMTTSDLYAASYLQEDFTGSTINGAWTAYHGACLTAGNFPAKSIVNPTGTPALTYVGTIPQCNGHPYYIKDYVEEKQVGLTNNADPVGFGALRLTNGANYTFQDGAIISTNAVDAKQGLQVTFSTVTYGGNNFYNTGADGLAFYMIDGAISSPTLGANGGSLGYSCSQANAHYNGMVGAYLGLGVDEFGNFLNKGDNTATGIGFKAGTIGLRGKGEVNWTTLNAKYGIDPSDRTKPYYPSTLTSLQQDSAVKDTCRTGKLYNYNLTNGGQTNVDALDYNMIIGGNSTLPASQPISNEFASNRNNATPITYNLKISPTGLINFGYYYNGGSYQPVLTNQDLVAVNGALPSTFKFGFGAGSGGGTNVHEISCFSVDPLITSSSAAINTIQSGEFRTGIQTYLGGYKADNWTGQLVAKNIIANSNGTLSFATNANWDGSCVLTGGGCDNMGVDASGNAINTITVQSPSNRNILTWNGSVGTPFQWTSLSASQQSSLTSAATTTTSTSNTPAFSPATTGQYIVSFLRGDRTQEQVSGTLRKRYGVLADIMNASPVMVGAPVQNYPAIWVDRLYSTNNIEGASYGTFKTTNTSRLNVVYSGANDGLLHGFRTGSYAADGSYQSSNNDGKEVLAYMPNSVLVKAAKLANPLYVHDYYEGATPGNGDLYYGGAWHTWLVNGLGLGGKVIYALDITNPSLFAEANASTIVKGEWDALNITCDVASCNAHLGNTYGSPIIRRLHNGQWAIIFGNGFGSTSGKAGVYIGLVDTNSGAVSFRWLDTGTGSPSNPNGIAYVSSADLDDDRVVDYLYAGDLLGNVWRFDLTSNNVNYWAVSKFGNNTPTPFFKTNNSITTKVNIAVSTIRKSRRLIVMFASGQKTPMTLTSADTYLTGQQSVYGIWDWDMNQWNNGSTSAPVIQPSSSKYYSLTGPQTFNSSNLLQQTITTGGNYRNLSNTNTVNWGTDKAPGQFGWFVNLPDTNEQSVFNAIITGNNLQLNTTVPPGTGVLVSCKPNLPTTWQMAFNVLTGGGNAENYFADASGNYLPGTLNTSSIQGIKTSSFGSSSVIEYHGDSYIVTNDSTPGNGGGVKINFTGNYKADRIGGWRQIK